MTTVVLYFQVHQPYRLRPYSFFDIGASDRYFDDDENRRILERVATRCYLPMNELLARAIADSEGRFRCTFSISGTALDQFEAWSPETLASFQRLAATGAVEFLAETSQHSLASVADPPEFAEFEAQVLEHRARVASLFGAVPTTLRNTELIVSNEIARIAERLGFAGLVAEGVDRVLGKRDPFRAYRVAGCERLRALLRCYAWSDDIAFRFGNRAHGTGALTAESFAARFDLLSAEQALVGVFLDYETFGEHQRAETGIFEFMEALPSAVLRGNQHRFATAAQAIAEETAVEELDVPDPISWADTERDISAWLGNDLQRGAHVALYEVGHDLRELDASDPSVQALRTTWRRLTTSDHFYYMSTKTADDGGVHEYFRPYGSPEEAFIYFMNVMDDLTRRLAIHRATHRAPPLRGRR